MTFKELTALLGHIAAPRPSLKKISMTQEDWDMARAGVPGSLALGLGGTTSVHTHIGTITVEVCNWMPAGTFVFTYSDGSMQIHNERGTSERFPGSRPWTLEEMAP